MFVPNASDEEVFFAQMVVEHIPQLIVQENHYYPFGLELAGLNKRGKPEHRWKFGGKEFDKTFGLNWADFKARQYDSQLGRWHRIDPKANEFYVWSPYNYALNNPLKYIDPDGKKPLDHIYLDKSGYVMSIVKTDGPHRLFVAEQTDRGTKMVSHEVQGVDQRILDAARKGHTMTEATVDAINEANPQKKEVPAWARFSAELLAGPVVSAQKIINGTDPFTDEKVGGGEKALGVLDFIPGGASGKAAIKVASTFLVVKVGKQTLSGVKIVNGAIQARKGKKVVVEATQGGKKVINNKFTSVKDIKGARIVKFTTKVGNDIKPLTRRESLDKWWKKLLKAAEPVVKKGFE